MSSRAMARVTAGLVGLTALLFPLLSRAQGWTGEVGGGYTWQNVSGSEESFRSQTGEQDGFVLDRLVLAYGSAEGAPESFRLSAWGFGGAEPDRHARLLFRPMDGWSFHLDYDRRESYFRTATQDDFLWNSERWAVERWKAGAVWDGWSAARLGLTLRYTSRSGDLIRPLYGLNEFYSQRVDLDETMKEATFRVETKTLPVRLVFEQSYARYDRKNRPSSVSRQAINGTDPDLLTGLTSDRREKQTVPTSRLLASYRNDRVELSGAFLYSSMDLDATGTGWQSYDIGGGAIGTIDFVDQLIGSARQDTRAGNVRARIALGSGWALRVSGDYRDSSADSSQIGERLLRATGPGGYQLVFSSPVDEAGVFDVTDNTARLEVEKRGAGWAVWAGAHTGSREVDWRRTRSDSRTDVKRDARGWVLGGSWTANPRFRVNGEYERGTFERYALRTDPESSNRLTVRVRSTLGGGWSAGGRFRTERAHSPSSAAGLDHRSDAFGAVLDWNDPKGRGGVGFNLDKSSLTTETDLVLPGGALGLSRYDLDLLTVGVNGHVTVGRVGLVGNLLRVKDTGDTWPSASWVGLLEATISGPKNTEYVFFARYRSYDENRATLDDFDATRYGFTVRWRF